MQSLESLGVSAPTYIVNTESPNVVAWTQAYQQQASSNGGSQFNVMNVIKPDQSRVMVVDGHQQHQHQHAPQQGANILPQAPPSVITATSNPTYNRCLPKILSDLDCEMKIKQVLKCIENILLDGNELDQQSYKLPDRSLSPQMPKKKMKKDEEISLSQANMNIPPPSGMLAAQAVNKSGVRINVKVEPMETEKAARNGSILNMYQEQHIHQVPSASPRSPFDFARMPQQPQAPITNPAYGKAFPFNPYAFNGNNATQFLQQQQQQQQQPFLTPQQHTQAQQQLFIQQQLANHQQHLQNVQRLQAAHQQQLLNAGLHVMNHPIPHTLTPQQLQYLSAITSSPQQLHQQLSSSQHQATQPQQQQSQQQQQQQHSPPQHTQAGSSPHYQERAAEPSQQQTQPAQSESSSYPTIHMDEFPFPVFSHSIFDEVNQKRDGEQKKEGEESVFFFGNSSSSIANPNPMTNSQLISQMQAQFAAQQAAEGGGGSGSGGAELSKQSQELLMKQSAELRQSVLGSSLNLHNLPLLLGGLPLEEDDKWYLSLLNIDGIHEVNPPSAAGTSPPTTSPRAGMNAAVPAPSNF